ncbi:MAG: enhanced serine sensitivity protein SseB C-terminal domain-containing protein [Oscillospiraceae bacterium]|nr:enhanced serine sensitivity protein SseB C-terminal domain-containing protein [Oscillospiraceae bacterium]MBQ4545698.1 enhanced serine sensitivity protein SseB C-terminal domain-containing protein [Oscillospiraceae bacterium]
MSTDITNFESGLEVDSAADTFAANPDPQLLRDFFGKVEIANFLVPYRDKPTNIPLLDVKDKGKLLPIFSSFAAFEKSPLPKDKAIIMPFSRIDEIVKRSEGQINGIIINPHGKSMIFQRNGGKATEKKQGELRLMKPSFIPESIAAALRNYLSGCENVYSAYILWGQKDSEISPHLFIVIDFDGKREEFFPKVAEALRPCLHEGDNIEMAKADFKLLKAAEKLIKPVYKKP